MKNETSEPEIRTELNMADMIIMMLTVKTAYTVGCIRHFICFVKLVLVSQRLGKYFVLHYLFPYINRENGHMFS
jgi:hypothetical protein